MGRSSAFSICGDEGLLKLFYLFFNFFKVSSGPDFHGKAALINMALKPETFYFLRKDHSKAFRVLLRTLASAV